MGIEKLVEGTKHAAAGINNAYWDSFIFYKAACKTITTPSKWVYNHISPLSMKNKVKDTSDKIKATQMFRDMKAYRIKTERTIKRKYIRKFKKRYPESKIYTAFNKATFPVFYGMTAAGAVMYIAKKFELDKIIYESAKNLLQ